MKSMEEIVANDQQNITEDIDTQYDIVIEALKKAKEEKTPIDEGIIGTLVGGAAGLTFGPRVMTAICNALGIDTKGALGSLMTSRLILTAVAGKLGARI